MPGKYAGYEYFEPQSGRKVKVDKKTALNIQKDAFCFYRPLPAKKLNLLDLGKFMLQSISRADVIFVLTISFIISLLGLFLPFINNQIFDSVIPSGTKSDLSRKKRLHLRVLSLLLTAKACDLSVRLEKRGEICE